MPELFDLARKRLERQYLDVKFDPATGLSKEELVAEFERHQRENPEEPRILTRAWLFHLVCSRARIAVEPDDYFADKLEHHNLVTALRDSWWSKVYEEFNRLEDQPIPGSYTGSLDPGHTCPDWRNILKLGFTGLRDRAAGRGGAFYQAVAKTYEGAINLVRRLAALKENPALAALAERPPQTFHEALQLAYLYHELQEMEGEWVRSMGRFDLLYNDFYINDLKAGRLTRDQAKELLKYFWIKFFAKTQGRNAGKNFLFGPQANELTYLCFEVYQEMKTVDPKLSFRLSPETPQKLIDQVAGCILSGCTGIVTANDPAIQTMLMQNGKTPEDAEDFVFIGCYEPAVMGREVCCSASAAKVNLAKSVELALAEGDYRSFDEFMTAYFKILGSQIDRAFDRTRRWERCWPAINPSPFFSGTMDACLEKGRDVSEAGAQYNTTGFIAVGLANMADSLAVIEQLVFKENRCSLVELKAALAANWKGYDKLRLIAKNRVPKWGNNDPRVDRFAVQVADFVGKRINSEPNARGGVFQAALYAILTDAQDFGQDTGALPDGRLAGEPLAINTGATTGMEKNGVTSLINSVTKINLLQFPSGTVLDIMLHPSVVRGPEGVHTLSSIIKSHFAQGGMAIQFNIFDAEVLREAKAHPEKYANLQVRVCGWNVRFADLGPEEQDIYIAKAEVA